MAGIRISTTGTVTCWGNRFSNETLPGKFSSVAIYGDRNDEVCGIREDHTIECSRTSFGQQPFGVGTFETIAGRSGTICGTRTDGSAACIADFPNGTGLAFAAQGDCVAPVCGNDAVELFEECDDGNTDFDPGDYCASDCATVTCGIPVSVDSATPRAADALFILRVGVGSGTCDPRVCDVNSSGSIGAADALKVLRRAVGIGGDLLCPTA